MPLSLDVKPLPSQCAPGAQFVLDAVLRVQALCVFDPVLRLFVRRRGEQQHLVSSDTHQSGLFFPWLPGGDYGLVWNWMVDLPPGDYELGVSAGTVEEAPPPQYLQSFSVAAGTAAAPGLHRWRLTEPSRTRVEGLSWQQGMSNWFHRHFCHAATVIGEQFLAGCPQRRGRVLDVGGGDGITDLSLLLRYQPRELVLMDIVDHVRRLPQVARDNDLPLESLPDNFVFLQQGCQQIPYPDGYFDLVLSWGSLEHVLGGYREVLDEVWRVLSPGGVFFVNPGLYYSFAGSHLEEFFDDPYLHLKLPEEELKTRVLEGSPRRMDRAGFDATNEEYWRFYKELNPIRVADFEQELRRYGYTFIRGALRTNDLVEYSPQLQDYSLVDLAVGEAFFVVQKPVSEGGQR